MIAASPSLFRAWRFWASSAHPREAESDSFLACAAKTKQRLAAAGTRPCTLSLSSTIVVVSRVLREILRYSDRENIDNTYLVRNTWFPDRTQIRMIRFHHIESNSIRFIKNEIVSILKCPSFKRAPRNEINMNSCYIIIRAVRRSVRVTDETYI